MPEVEEISTEDAGRELTYEEKLRKVVPPEKTEWTKEELAEKLNTSIEEVSTAKTIDWGWKELVGHHAEALGELLSHAANVVNLNMFVNEVGPQGGKAIGKALPFMPKLVQVDLQQWQIEPEGAKYVAEALAKHPRIKSIKMHYCKLGWEGTEYIARAVAQHKTLTNLDLGDNGMDEAGARHIAAMLATNTSLTRLDLSKNEGLVDNPETKEWFLGEVTKIMAKRVTPLTLILENSPGKKWHPNDRPPPPVREDWRG
jgi:Ran GTPase-activating protein (RanGAP) involved in mRNA processing and transport